MLAFLFTYLPAGSLFLCVIVFSIDLVDFFHCFTCARVYWEPDSRIQFKVIPVKLFKSGVVGGLDFCSVPATCSRNRFIFATLGLFFYCIPSAITYVQVKVKVPNSATAAEGLGTDKVSVSMLEE